MRQTVRLGRVAGISIGANWSALIIAVLLGFLLATAILPAGAPGRSGGAYVLVAIVVALLFLAALLGHELAHALVARRYGVSVRRITLWLLGGVSEMDTEMPTPKAEFLIAGAGPLASLLFGGVAAGGTVAASAAHADRLIVVSLGWLAGVNILLGIFNLLPGAPLDGGRIVRSVVWRIRGDQDRAQIAADRAGIGLGFVLGGLGLLQILFVRNLGGLWLILLGWFLIRIARVEGAGAQLHRALGGRSVRDIMAADPVCGLDSQSVDAFVNDTAARHPHASYPVVDSDGRLVGLVNLSDLSQIPQPGRAQLPLRAAAVVATDGTKVAADEPAATAARNLSPATPLLAVTDHDRVVGVVGTGDVANAVALAGISRGNGGRRNDRG
jgi:Zn-dependent protease